MKKTKFKKLIITRKATARKVFDASNKLKTYRRKQKKLNE